MNERLRRPALTKRTPTETGLYWFTLVYRDATLRHDKVFKHRGKLCVFTDGIQPVSRLKHRWWAGPLREPVGHES